MIEVADASRGDHGDRHAIGDAARELQIVAVAGSVTVHAREQDLAGAHLHHFSAHADGVEAGGLSAAVREDLPRRVAGEPARRLASMATTMAWLPHASDARRTNSGSRTAAVLMDTLSAPARKRSWM